jgi:hypothetical protein
MACRSSTHLESNNGFLASSRQEIAAAFSTISAFDESLACRARRAWRLGSRFGCSRLGLSPAPASLFARRCALVSGRICLASRPRCALLRVENPWRSHISTHRWKTKGLSIPLADSGFRDASTLRTSKSQQNCCRQMPLRANVLCVNPIGPLRGEGPAGDEGRQKPFERSPHRGQPPRLTSRRRPIK